MLKFRLRITEIFLFSSKMAPVLASSSARICTGTLDYKGRWRNHTVAFRVSDEESKLLNDLVALSGLTKQDYITRRLLCRDVVVQGNPRVYKALKNQMVAIYEELKRLEALSPDNDELLYTLQVIAITLDGLKGEDE